MDRNMSVYELLPPDERRSWRSISVLAAACGGCGTTSTKTDAQYFAGQWLDNRQYRERLLNRELTHLGLAIAADGEGKTIAIAVLGQRR